MRFEWFIAARYLRGTHKGRVRICTAGVTIGVMVLIVVISVMNGFERDFLGKLLGAYGHLRLYPYTSDGILRDYPDWIERIEARPGIRAAAPAIEQEGMIVARPPRYNESVSQGIAIRGIDPAYELRVNDFDDFLLIGHWDSLAPRTEPPPSEATAPIDPFAMEAELPTVFLGVELAKYLFKIPGGWRWSGKNGRLRRALEEVVLGSEVTLVVPDPKRSPSGLEPFFMTARIGGIFKTGFYDFDLRYVLTSLETSRILKGLPPDPSGAAFLEVRVEDPLEALHLGLSIGKWAEENYDVSLMPVPWQQLKPTILEAVRIEKVVMSAILTMVVLVAAFGISSTLVMTVIEKTREIGTLMSMGTRRVSILMIFVLNGWMVGVFGVSLGVVFGVALCRLIDLLNIRMPGGGEIYVLDRLPVEIRWGDVAVIAVLSLLAATLAGAYPAWKASRLDPVEALGHD